MATIDPALRIRSVRLAVADLARSAEFYERVLGLALLEQDDGRALLGADPADPALELVAIDGGARPAPPRSTGLFHVAWLHPSREALADTVRRIAASRWPLTGASDHGVSEALYLDDPDGLGIEVYADRPREQWGRGPGGGYEIFTAPLDLDDLMSTSTSAPEPRVAPGTGIGHVHLKVAEVDRAARFYERLGFDEQARIPAASFLSAGGYHHHIGVNTWQSAGAAPAPPQAPGLRRVAFELSGLAALDELAAAAAGDAERHDGELRLADADGQALSFSARA
ncbi:MAG TPA: VOC family protein [Solirubrobacteraceae bacterium]|jgi:catechol 2,3-dioxygenase|nr:VOC family protein [Solirubrobacteraceae bacterium]